jgi:small subunit ribosomal protein S16
VAVKIRMKMMGRKHRPFFRVCAVDSRFMRDGRVIEELGTYDPMIGDTDARALLNGERINYWLGVGAQPSERVKTLIKKYGLNGTRLAEHIKAREHLSLPKPIPPAPEAVYVHSAKKAEAEQPAAEAAPVESSAAPEEAAAETTSS